MCRTYLCFNKRLGEVFQWFNEKRADLFQLIISINKSFSSVSHRKRYHSDSMFFDIQEAAAKLADIGLW